MSEDIAVLINRCKNLGYEITAQNGSIRYKYIGNSPPSKAGHTLLELIKANKKQVINYLSENYEDYFQTATQRIAQDYQAGTIDYVRRKHPGRFQESLQIENRLNEFWDKDFQKFKKAVDDWREIELELIKLFIQETN